MMIVQLLTTEIHNVKVADMTDQRVENYGKRVFLCRNGSKIKRKVFDMLALVQNSPLTVTPVTVTQ